MPSPATAQGEDADKSAPVSETTEATTARDQALVYVNRTETAAALTAERDFWQAELRRIEGLSPSVIEQNDRLELEAAGLLNQALADNTRALFAVTKDLARDSEVELRKQRQQWLEERTALHSARAAVFESSAADDFLGRVATVLSVENRWLWFCGSLALGTLTALFLIDRRHRLRRLLHVRKSRTIFVGLLIAGFLLLVFTPAILTLFFGDFAYQRLLALRDSERAPEALLANELAELPDEAALNNLKTEIADLQRRAEQAREQQREEWDLPATMAPFLDERVKSREALQSATVSLAVRKAIARRRQQDAQLLSSALAERDSKRAEITQARNQKRTTAGFLGLTLLGLTAVLGGIFLRSRARRWKQLAETCPQCLAVGTLELTPDGRLDEPELRCSKVIREEPRYEECEFTFPAAYRNYPKLGFPTLGVATSGKTHWMSMIFRELNNGRYPAEVSFQPVKSRGSVDMDRLVERILGTRMKLPGTVANRLPDPVVFSFQDSDRFAKSTVLTSLFDYAGQITTDVGHHHRRRALDGDGFFFFIDPTKPAERQAKALADFAEDLKLVKKLKPGQQLHTPVALCVTRLDLMICDHRVTDADGKRVNLNNTLCRNTENTRAYYQELGRLDREYRPMSLQLLEKRSELTARMRGDIWGEWNIESQIRNLFGSRFLFFPMTPVGLNDLPLSGPATAADLAHIVDLNRRIIQPYAILEPLLWLLQMNGYPVLK